MTRAPATCAATGCFRQVEPGMLMCKSHWFTLPKPLRDEVWRTWRACLRNWSGKIDRDEQLRRSANYREAVRTAIAYLEVVPARAEPFPVPAADPKPTLREIADHIDIEIAKRQPPEIIFSWLKFIGGRYRFAHGTYEFRIQGVAATCTAGGIGLLRAWQRAAERKIAGEVQP